MPNGLYRVRTVSGDPTASDGRHHLTVEGVTMYDAPQPGGNNTYLDATADLLVNDGRITVAAGANGVNTKLNFIEIDPVLGDTVIALTSPVNNSTVLSPASITLEAGASATTGSITKVEFFNGPTKLGEDGNQPYSFVWFGASVGNHTLTAKATNSNGSVAVSAIVNVIVNSPATNGWNTWRDAQFNAAQLEDLLISGVLADPDKDGIANLLEYGMGLPPLLNSQANLPVMSRAGDIVTMIYRKSTDAADVTLNLQVSTNLTSWGSNGMVETITGTTNGIQTVQATYTVPAGNKNLFMRIRCVK